MYSHCEYCNRKDYENCAHVLLISIEWVRINIWNGNLDTDKLQNILIDQVTVNNLLQMINCYKVILFSDGPSISVDKLYMTHHRQLTLELVCSAQSNPPASLQWSRMDDTTRLWSPVGPNIGDNTRDMDGVWTENRQVSPVVAIRIESQIIITYLGNFPYAWFQHRIFTAIIFITTYHRLSQKSLKYVSIWFFR